MQQNVRFLSVIIGTCQQCWQRLWQAVKRQIQGTGFLKDHKWDASSSQFSEPRNQLWPQEVTVATCLYLYSCFIFVIIDKTHFNSKIFLTSFVEVLLLRNRFPQQGTQEASIIWEIKDKRQCKWMTSEGCSVTLYQCNTIKLSVTPWKDERHVENSLKWK